ncbi:MAG: hypothetical protein K9H64_14715 [Bacteroidales bacterium]|nr:hypothetical protein [Bacteroidales bacterium]MCF8457218.1 hypothetical protein [Bacteroidales bacterium]
MKKGILIVLIPFVGLFISIYAQNKTPIIVPYENQRTFVDHNQTFIYQERDSVYVSIGFNYYRDGELIFDVTIDNQSSDTLAFDPGQIYLFRYAQGSLAEQKAYHPLDAQNVLDSINYSIEKRTNKIKKNTVFSVLLWAFYVAAEIAGATGDMNYNTLDAIAVAHDIAQTGLEIGRQNNEDKLYYLSFDGDYWLNRVFKEGLIFPHTFESGNIHFKVEQSEIFKIDIPIGYRIFSYRFEEVYDNPSEEKEL